MPSRKFFSLATSEFWIGNGKQTQKLKLNPCSTSIIQSEEILSISDRNVNSFPASVADFHELIKLTVYYFKQIGEVLFEVAMTLPFAGTVFKCKP